MLIGFAAASAVLAGRLVWIQALDSSAFVALGTSQRERRISLPPQRGSIRDRNGALLALSLERRSVYANPRFVPDAKAAARALSTVLGAPASALEPKLSARKGFVYLARKVTIEQAQAALNLKIPGIYSVPESKRFYPDGSLGAHVIGFAGFDNQGLAGLESRYESILAGKPGEMMIESDPNGRSIPAGKTQVSPPSPGEDLILTLDRDIQYQAETSLAAAVSQYHAKGGSIVVLEPGTGEVLAMANYPSFDANQFDQGPRANLINQAVASVYEPGSANKVVTVAASIETGTIKPDETFSVPDTIRVADRTFHDSHPHGRLDLTLGGIIERSSNVGTIQVAMQLGKDRLYDYLSRFGYGRMTGLDFPGEASGILPRPGSWSKTSLPTIGIGQGVAVTPLQIATVYATVANGGVRVSPRLLAATVDPGGGTRPAAPGTAMRVISPETARQVTDILLRVVEGQEGTARLAAIPGYRVAGKTGTAQKPQAGGGYSGYVSSFIGYAPAFSPRLVVGVVLDDPTPIWGGDTAAPTFQQVMSFSLHHLGIEPGPDAAPAPAPARASPPSPSPAPASSDTPD